MTLISFLIASCSKDEKTVLGNWDFAMLVNTNCTDSSNNQSGTFTNGCFKQNFIFLEIELCGKAVFTDKNYTITTTISGGGETETEIETGTYSIDGEKISFTASTGEKYEGTVNGDRNNITFKFRDEEIECDQTITMVKK